MGCFVKVKDQKGKTWVVPSQGARVYEDQSKCNCSRKIKSYHNTVLVCRKWGILKQIKLSFDLKTSSFPTEVTKLQFSS